MWLPRVVSKALVTLGRRQQSMANKQAAATASDRRNTIIEAATDVFLRYGYARTTMEDLARAASISRPALYLVFPRKDDVFSAVLKRLSDESLRRFREALPGLGTLEKRLHFCCEAWGTHGFDMIAAHPDAKDLFDLSFVAVQEVYASFRDFIAEMITEAVAASKMSATTTAGNLAGVLVYAMRGFEEVARDKAEMHGMISLHVDVLLASLKA